MKILAILGGMIFLVMVAGAALFWFIEHQIIFRRTGLNNFLKYASKREAVPEFFAPGENAEVCKECGRYVIKPQDYQI
jgi:hypothetical protein